MKGAVKKWFDKELSNVLTKHGAFWAFSNEQVRTNPLYNKDVKYVSMGAGLICPKEQAKSLDKAITALNKLCTAKRLKTEGLDGIILYELQNHECFWKGDYDDVIELLAEYGASEADIKRVFDAHVQTETWN